MFLQESGYCLPGSNTPPQLTKVLSDPPWSLRRAARGFVSATLDVYSWSPGSQKSFIASPIFVLPTTHPPALVSQLRHATHYCKSSEGKECISHPTPSKNMLAFLSTAVVNSPWAPQTRPSSVTASEFILWSGKGGQAT